MAYQSFTDFSTNSSNPYYLHPNENPALVLVTPVLDDKNYHTWARSMNIALISKNKEKFIDGTLPKPPVSDVLYAPWIRCNTMVLAWIHRSISDSIARSILWIENAVDVWKNLKIRFSHGDIFRISDIQEDLYKLRQGNLDVSNYFTQMKVLWDELEAYRPITACSCAIPCSCGALASIRTYREQDYVIRFLKGLSEKFMQSKTQIMMMQPLPDIEKAFSLVIQQERELNSSQSVISNSNMSEESTTLHINSSSGNNSNKNSNTYFKGKNGGNGVSKGHSRVCTHCGRTNHTVETCFTKHGYPPGFRGKGKAFTQATHSQSIASIETGQGTPQQHSAQSMVGFTQEQYQSILELIQQSKLTSQANSISTSPFILNTHSHPENGKNSQLWILDTGATDHIAFDLSIFISHNTIVPIHVSLPNGSHVTASISGSIALSPNLVLHNVLYIPSFHVNLISIAKLVHTNNCVVHFTNDSCKILQNQSMEVIGTTRLQRGLYVLHSSYDQHACNSSMHNDSFLWHLRLGHISNIGLHNVSKVFPFIPSKCNNDTFPCDPCHFSK